MPLFSRPTPVPRASRLERLVVAGLAFASGLCFGMLLAPRSGADTRERIGEQARTASTWLEDQARAVTEPTAEALRETTEAARRRYIPLAGSEWDLVDGRAIMADVQRSR
ncbi:MAG: YtxH domain-containing protein [Bacteroidota bacterium]